jgi:hypothetical protein
MSIVGPKSVGVSRLITRLALLVLGLLVSASWTGSANGSWRQTELTIGGINDPALSCKVALAGDSSLSSTSFSSPKVKGKSENPACPTGTACCGVAPNTTLGTGNAESDLWVFGGTCTANPGQTYMYRDVHIFNGGTLQFKDDGKPATKTDFRAANILIEGSALGTDADKFPGGTLRAGSVDANGNITPFGGTLTIHLYGQDLGRAGAAAACASDQFCGAGGVWGKNGKSMSLYPTQCQKSDLPGTIGGKPVNDCFYDYDAMPFDTGKPPPARNPNNQSVGYFGYKVIGVGYNGTLQLFGKKGATYDTTVNAPIKVAPANTGTSWVRLNNCAANPNGSFCNAGVLQPGANTLVPSSPVDWQVGDNIVISSTDYLPGHAEQVQITCVDGGSCPDSIQFAPALMFPHNAAQYSLSKVTGNQKPTGWTSVDTRASVALLSRSITIESGGDAVLDPFPPPNVDSKGDPDPKIPSYYFGGHMVIRQGFKTVQIQGVGFHWMGQGGKLGHYPVHFHMSRQIPDNTFVKDTSVWDSMTRWYVLHATQGVLLARNVGYLSIGHGYYLEDGTETDNKLYANIGVFARGAVTNKQNPRNVPGILASPDYPIIPSPPPPPPPCGGAAQPKCPTKVASPSDDIVPYHSDWDHPTLFWIMNGWNDFEYNMAAGAGTCGVCYWLLPGINSGGSRNMKWESYASEQQLPDSKTSGGTTPLQIFTGNSCVSAMNSFLTVANTTACNGVQIGPNQVNADFPVLNAAPPPTSTTYSGVSFPLAPSSQSGTTPDPTTGLDADNYYPHIGGGGRFPTKCPASGDCSTQKVCADSDQKNCVVTTIDHYTTSFNWAATNFAAVWLRPQWYLFINCAITDVQNGGITFVTGGGYTHSDVINGHWALAKKNVFIGNTQSSISNDGDPLATNSSGFAANVGPFNPLTFKTLTPPTGTAPPQRGGGCAQALNGANPGNYCLSPPDGISFQMSGFANNQRLFSIYDGPAYEDSNAYLDIKRTNLPNDALKGCNYTPKDGQNNHNCANSQYSQIGGELGMPWDANNNTCYIPNAAIAWKQPNGFYYPPAFHSRNLLFNNVDIRHFVIEPLFASTGVFQTDLDGTQTRYCTYSGDALNGMFTGFTDVDRQTELNDDDGTLTGLVGPTATPTPTPGAPAFTSTGLIGSISVNQDKFFQAPVQTPECLSDVDVTPAQAGNVKNYPGTATTSPYDYVTTVVFPGCAANTAEPSCASGSWDMDCTNQNCFGVPLYREYLLPDEMSATPILLMGQATYQRSSLTTNNNRYFIDTTRSKTAQSQARILHFSVFQPEQTYYVFLLLAKPTTKQTYDLYVGKNFVVNTDNVWLTRVKLPSEYLITKSGTGTIPGLSASNYNPTTGVLSVTLDMSEITDADGKSFADLYAAQKKSQCQPATFCEWVGNPAPGDDHCQCADSIFSPPSATFQTDECSTKGGICSWATEDVDCPVGGCFGFGVKLANASNFVYSDAAPNLPPVPAPSPTPFPSGPPWKAAFTSPVSTSDACYYPNPPTMNLLSDENQ